MYQSHHLLAILESTPKVTYNKNTSNIIGMVERHQSYLKCTHVHTYEIAYQFAGNEISIPQPLKQ